MIQGLMLTINNDQYYLKGKSNKLAVEILRAMKIKQTKNLIAKEEFKL